MSPDTGKFQTLVRLGYVSRAVLYIVLGLIALGIIGSIAEGTRGIFETLRSMPGGTLLLWVLVFGLAGYAIFRAASPLIDIENNGSDAKGWAKRLCHGGSAIGHLALAWTAYKFATGSGAGEGNGASQAAAGVMSIEFGGVLIGFLGVAFLGAAVAQAIKALTASFMRRISPSAPSATRWLGRIGYLARSLVFAVIGWSLIQASLSRQTSNVKTLGEAVASLADTGWLFQLVALGLLLFGAFSLVLARYRIIPDVKANPVAALRQKVA